MNNKIKRLSVFLVSAFLFFAFVAANPLTVNALTDADVFQEIVSGKYEFEGVGTKEDPFQIRTYEDLVKLRECVECGVTYLGYYFAQTQDITFPDGENWEPIGDLLKDYAFAGVYDGRGHVLNNVQCKDPYASVFEWLRGEIWNLGIESGTFSGADIGSIVSHGSAEAKIINCYNKASVIGNDRAGGITDNYGGKILYCWNLGEVSGSSDRVVTAGITSYSGYKTATIEYCYTTSYNIVVDSTYSGSVTNSNTITADQISRILEESAAQIGCSKSSEDISHRNLVFMEYQDGSLRFADAVPKAYWAEYVKAYLMIALLALVCVVMGIAALILRPWKHQPPAPAARKTAVKSVAEVPVTELSNEEKKQLLTKRTLATVMTLVMFAGAFSYVNGILTEEYPEGSLNMDEYKSSGVVPDVLLLGSSTMATNIEVVDLWNNYGIAAHCLGGASASMHDNYYRLLSAEEAHIPDMVILDVKAVSHWTEFATEEGRIKNITGVNLSLNKLNYLNAALPMEQRMDYLMNIPLFHTRYTTLGMYDFAHTSVYGSDDKGNWSIFYGNKHAPTLIDGNEIKEYRAIHEKPEFYLRQIIAHCKEKGIELLLIKTPDAAREKNQPYYNTVALLAEECGVPFLNLNLMDAQTGLVSTDFYHDNDHLNVVGARKCTKVLGEYLEANYDLPDRRGDETYSSWTRYAALKDTLYMMQINNRDEYFAELKRNGKKLIVVPLETEGITAPEFTDVISRLDGLGYEILDSGEVELGRVKLMKEENRKSIVLNVQDKNGSTAYTLSSPGLILLVYDEVLDEVADIVVFSKAYGYSLHRLFWAR